jgi:hypothetical protein
VALGAGGVSLQPLGPLGRLIAEYSLLSGAETGYGFFAAGVGGQIRVRFDVIDGEGQETTASLNRVASHEADLRIGNIIDRFWEEDEELGLRRSLAASLAGTIFARYPQAHKVVVHAESFEPVSMDDFRRGVRPEWTPLYEAKFVYQSRQTKDTGDGTGAR